MDTVGTIVSTFSGPTGQLNDRDFCMQLVGTIVTKTGMTQLSITEHRFKPQGFSTVWLLAESHIALHTWPENGTGYITFSTCKYDETIAATVTSILKDSGLTPDAVRSVV